MLHLYDCILHVTFYTFAAGHLDHLGHIGTHWATIGAIVATIGALWTGQDAGTQMARGGQFSGV